MKREAVIVFALQNVVLIAISVVLIVGFWYHGAFYRLGLPWLIVLGGAIVFGVIQAVRFAHRPMRYLYRAAGSLTFDQDEVVAVNNNIITSVILRRIPDRLHIGVVLNARLSKDTPPVTRLIVRDIYRKRADAVTRDERTRAGYRSKSDFYERAVEPSLDTEQRDGNGSSDPLMNIVHFEVLDAS